MGAALVLPPMSISDFVYPESQAKIIVTRRLPVVII